MLEYNKTISREAIDLMKRILKVNPEDRLNLEEVFDHSWLKKYEKIY